MIFFLTQKVPYKLTKTNVRLIAAMNNDIPQAPSIYALNNYTQLIDNQN